MHDSVHYTEIPELSLEVDKTSLCPSGLDRGCPYQNLHVYVLNGVLAAAHEPKFGNAFMGNWVEDETTFLFFSAPAENEIDGVLRAIDGLEVVEKHVFPYEVWQGGPVEPVWVDHFVIVPPWVSMMPEAGMKMIIDPGVVFGNCLHPTTRDCLRALSLAASQTELGAVLDLGTGTGVLSVAAALLGADSVTGVDVNPLCVRTARKNVAFNELENVRVVEGEALAYAEKPADALMANIPCAVTKELLKSGAFRGKKRVILSGLMRTQARDIEESLRSEGFMLVREWDHQMTWFTFLAEMK